MIICFTWLILISGYTIQFNQNGKKGIKWFCNSWIEMCTMSNVLLKLNLESTKKSTRLNQFEFNHIMSCLCNDISKLTV
jgi:hypothetical protein